MGLILMRILFVLLFTALAMMGGGLIGGRLISTQTGWDAIANFLGGLMLGGVVGLALSLFLISKLYGRSLTPWWWVLLAVAAIEGAVILLLKGAA